MIAKNRDKMLVDNQGSSGALVAKGASYLFAQGLAANISSLLFLVIAARMISVSSIGAISALGIIGTLFMTIGTFAVPSGATKYISEYLGKNEQDKAKETYRKCLKFGFLMSVVVSIACLALSGPISAFALNDPLLQPIIMILAVDVGALIFNSFLNGTLFGLQRFRSIAVVGISVSIVKLVGPLFLLSAGLGLLGIVVGWIVADLVSDFLLFFLVSSSFGNVRSSNELSFRRIFRYSLPLHGASIVAYFSATVDRFVVLSLSDLAVLGVYSVAVAAVNAIGIVSSAMGSSLFPQLARIHGRYGKTGLKEASVKSSRYLFLIFTPLVIGLLATAYPTIQFFFGESYTSGSLPVAIVSIATALTSASMIVSSLLLSLDMTRTILETSLVSVATGAVFCALLVSPLGSVGAAIGRAALLLSAFAYSAYVLKKVFGLYFDITAFKKSLLCSAAMAIGVIAAQSLLSGTNMLPLYVAIGSVIYILMLKLLKALNAEDFELLKEILPSRFQRFTSFFEKFFSLKD